MTRERRVSGSAGVGMGGRLFCLIEVLLLVALASAAQETEPMAASYLNYPSLFELKWNLWESQKAEGLVVCLVDDLYKTAPCGDPDNPPIFRSDPECVLPHVFLRFWFNRTVAVPNGRRLTSRLFELSIKPASFSYITAGLFCRKITNCELWNAMGRGNNERRITRDFLEKNGGNITPQVYMVPTQITQREGVKPLAFRASLSLWTPSADLLSKSLFLEPALRVISETSYLTDEEYSQLYSGVLKYLTEYEPRFYTLRNPEAPDESIVEDPINPADFLKETFAKLLIGNRDNIVLRPAMNFGVHASEEGYPQCRLRYMRDVENATPAKTSELPEVANSNFLEASLYGLLRCHTLEYLHDAFEALRADSSKTKKLPVLLDAIKKSKNHCRTSYLNSLTDAVLTPLTATIPSGHKVKPVSQALSAVAAVSLEEAVGKTRKSAVSHKQETAVHAMLSDSGEFVRCMGLATVSQRLQVLGRTEAGQEFNEVLGLLTPSVKKCMESFDIPSSSEQPSEEDHVAQSIATDESSVDSSVSKVGDEDVAPKTKTIRPMRLVKILRCTVLSFTVDTITHSNSTLLKNLSDEDIEQLREEVDLCRRMRLKITKKKSMSLASEAASFGLKALRRSFFNDLWSKAHAAVAPAGESNSNQQSPVASVAASEPKHEATVTPVNTSEPKQQTAAQEKQDPERPWLLMGSAGTLLLGLACVSGVIAHGGARRASGEVVNEDSHA